MKAIERLDCMHREGGERESGLSGSICADPGTALDTASRR